MAKASGSRIEEIKLKMDEVFLLIHGNVLVHLQLDFLDAALERHFAFAEFLPKFSGTRPEFVV